MKKLLNVVHFNAKQLATTGNNSAKLVALGSNIVDCSVISIGRRIGGHCYIDGNLQYV